MTNLDPSERKTAPTRSLKKTPTILAAAELAPLLRDARTYLSQQSYRSCVTCHQVYVPTDHTDRRCPACVAGSERQIAHGPSPLPK